MLTAYIFEKSCILPFSNEAMNFFKIKYADND